MGNRAPGVGSGMEGAKRARTEESAEVVPGETPVKPERSGSLGLASLGSHSSSLSNSLGTFSYVLGRKRESTVSVGSRSNRHSSARVQAIRSLDSFSRMDFRTSSGRTMSGPFQSPRPVDPQTREFLASVMQKHFVFAKLQESAYDQIFSCMRHISKLKDEAIFVQGDVGDSCYFIHSGIFAVCIDGKEVKQLGPMETFGELALLYQMRRSATVTCIQPGELWQMDNASFLRCMEQLNTTHLTRAHAFLKSNHNFRGLPERDQRLLASKCSTQHFTHGEVILREGEVGEWMFVTLCGRVIPTDESLAEQYDTLSGSILGAAALVYNLHQTMGFRAKGNVTCLALPRSALPALTERIADLLRRCAVASLLQHLPRPPEQPPLASVLTDSQRHRLIGSAEDGVFEPSEVVACPGDPAQLLVVLSGDVAILSQLASTEMRYEGDLIFCTRHVDVRARAERVLSHGCGCGEQPELLTGCPMTRFVVALTRARLHRFTHVAAQRALGMPPAEAVRVNEIKRVLADIFLFKNLSEEKIDRTVRRMERQAFPAGEVIVRQDDPARHFFLIQSGTISVKIGLAVVRTLGRWDYFGERGLLLQERRSATCMAMEDAVCLVLEADVFFEIVGMFRKELERRMHLQDLNIKISDLQCKAVVGRGSFGVVRLVNHKSKERTRYALKCVKKWQVVRQGQQSSIIVEREVNAQCYHPCIVQFIKTFQDKDYVYFLTEFLGGGDLFTAIRQIGTLTQLQVQFFSGSIVLGIEYLHARGIMYRDLKPENVLLDFEGYAKLVDFGCCKKEFRTSTLIGTPEYIAPEVITGAGYTCVVDWWSLGVMMYEFIVGPLPFGANCADNTEQVFRAILEEPLDFPERLEESAITVLEGLLNRQASRRLGAGRMGAKEIKEQVYFQGFDWDALAGGFLEPPWKPDTEALIRQWEPPDGDLMDNVKTESFTLCKGMEWAKHF